MSKYDDLENGDDSLKDKLNKVFESRFSVLFKLYNIDNINAVGYGDETAQRRTRLLSVDVLQRIEKELKDLRILLYYFTIKYPEIESRRIQKIEAVIKKEEERILRAEAEEERILNSCKQR